MSKQQKVAEDLKQDISLEQKNADEQAINIEGQRKKIEKEKIETEQLAADADAELKKAEPALLAAQEAIEGLSKAAIQEVKSFATPPPDVVNVMNAVMIVMSKEPTWQSAKRELAEPDFIKKIKGFDAEKDFTPAILKKVEKFTKNENF